MKHKGEIMSVVILFLACGDNDGMTTTSTATMTQPGTSNPSTAMSDEDSSITEGKTTGSASGTTSTPPTSGTTEADGGPEFLSFSSNVSKITQGESVTFTALLTDPDGVADIIGGSLLSENEKIDFGPFIDAGQPGTYSISLSWAQIHQSDPIAFEDTATQRVFRARFFDQKGNQALRDAEVLLTCSGGSACDGACTDLNSDGMNCGSCGHSCASKGCQSGNCTPNLSGCFEASDGLDTCTLICQSIGETCAESQCKANGFTAEYFDVSRDCSQGLGGVLLSEPCDIVQDWVTPAIKCCCTDSH